MAFLAPLVAPLFATTSAAIATTAVVGATAYTVAQSQAASAAKKSAMASPLTSPNAPQNYSAIAAQETTNALRRSQAKTKTILTNPLGVSDSGTNIQRKTLLGA